MKNNAVSPSRFSDLDTWDQLVQQIQETLTQEGVLGLLKGPAPQLAGEAFDSGLEAEVINYLSQFAEFEGYFTLEKGAAEVLVAVLAVQGRLAALFKSTEKLGPIDWPRLFKILGPTLRLRGSHEESRNKLLRQLHFLLVDVDCGYGLLKLFYELVLRVGQFEVLLDGGFDTLFKRIAAKNALEEFLFSERSPGVKLADPTRWTMRDLRAVTESKLPPIQKAAEVFCVLAVRACLLVPAQVDD